MKKGLTRREEKLVETLREQGAIQSECLGDWIGRLLERAILVIEDMAAEREELRRRVAHLEGWKDEDPPAR